MPLLVGAWCSQCTQFVNRVAYLLGEEGAPQHVFARDAVKMLVAAEEAPERVCVEALED